MNAPDKLPPETRQPVSGYLWGALAVLTCPCHLPILAAVLAGTTAGAFLGEHWGVAALALPVAAHAQDNAPAGQSDNGEDVETAEELEQALGGNTIVVTATKREQTLQEAPVSVSVTTGETLERAEIRDLIDVQTVTPSLRVSQLQNSSTTTFIINK